MNEVAKVLSVSSLKLSFATKGEADFVAIHNISFDLHQGKTLAIVGESGSGKSLTALSLMGLQPTVACVGGTINLNINDSSIDLITLTKTQWGNIRGKAMGMVFQEPMSALNPVMTVGKQLTEVITTHQKIDKKLAVQQAIHWLQQVKLPSPEKLYHRYPHELSGGQKQRVMIAMAMCNSPVVLIADEPTTALDATVQQDIIMLMSSLQKQTQTAMIFITHDLALASSIADDVMVMYQGGVVEYGAAKTVLIHPQHPYTKALLACRPSPKDKGKKLPIVADFLAKNSDAILKEKEEATQPMNMEYAQQSQLLKVNGLKVWFTEKKDWFGKPQQYFKAVDDVSFEIKKGEVLGLVGESGCGKSTLSRSLLGLLPANAGQIFYNHQDIIKYNSAQWRQMRREIQMIFQDPFASLNPRMNIGDMLMEPMMVHNIVPKQQLRAEALKLLSAVQLSAHSMKRYPHQFSGGQRQRVGIARALALRPKLIICDESVSALDVSVQAQILNLLKELQSDFELSYLFISHDLSVVHYISDKVIVMQSGKIVEQGDAEKVLLHPTDNYTKKLVAAMP